MDEGRFFLLPNAIFTLGLRPGEMTVYAYLIFCEDRKSHQCWPSIGHISQHTDMSANTVAKYIRQLEEERLIDTEPTKVKTKAQSALYDPSYPRGGELQAGTRFGSPVRAKTHEEKTVRTKLGPVWPCVRFLGTE